MNPNPRLSVLLVLASWQVDAPAGIERATAALAAGLAEAGHHVVIATGAPQPADQALPGVTVEPLDLGVTFPCSDTTLRDAITAGADKLQARLRDITEQHRTDTIVFTDALWGLGRLDVDLPLGIRRILAVHVLPHAEDMRPALALADTVIVPSEFVRFEAQQAGWPTSSWHVVPNALLREIDPPPLTERLALREDGPIRVLARLGTEKGVLPLLTAAACLPSGRPLHVQLAAAAFESADGSQETLLGRCRDLADRADHITLTTGTLPWDEVPLWLSEAALVIVPSLRETFGLVALEAMSVGAPVIAYRTGNLPALLQDGIATRGLLGELMHGPNALLRLAQRLLADPIAYGRTSEAMYHLSQDYRPLRIAQLFVKAVS
ncbi:glycosyltransferase family 4 protein [Streptomyces zhihengii]|uniref:Glycosyltransferase family 4 protein n=1 Tax=Streptomyces zhihengii TaxID=1818004 RepID=A0ABS2V6S5_9ACTN|nr:glycosyltransferase family 4 protein [Streptomyces zhihengii]MBM9624702.1 glycosyltransferase family 4 protein [Streptomyces zhihengii]